MMTTFRVLFPDGSVLHGSVDWPVEPGRDLVGPLVRPYLNDEPFERVTIAVNAQLCDMIIAEMGHVRLSTRAPLSVNPTATALYRDNYARLYPNEDREMMPTIAGAAVLFDRQVIP